MRRILFLSTVNYFDDSTGASVACRAMFECLASNGFAVEAICSPYFENDRTPDLNQWFKTQGLSYEERGTGTLDDPRHCVVSARGVSVTLIRAVEGESLEARAQEATALSRLYGEMLDRFRPDVVVAYGMGRLPQQLRSIARARGATVVIPVHVFKYSRPHAFAETDAAIVPSQFAADYYRRTAGVECRVLPNPIDWVRCRAERHSPRYLTFVNPSLEKGVYVFARIAEELTRLRPDIPLQIIESRGTAQTLRGCGINPEALEQVRVVAHTPDPGSFWGETRVCLLPSLWWENQPLVAIEAMINGIPVVGSNRGGIPETLGDSGIILPIPDRITEATRLLPTAEEVRPWIEAIIRLWDDAGFYEERRRKSLAEARRWAPEVVEPQYLRYFEEVGRETRLFVTEHPERARSVVLVPHLQPISPECEESLRQLEQTGVHVIRRGQCLRIDEARSALASEALRKGYESMLFLDPDLSFYHLDALRLFARSEAVICGIAAKLGEDKPDGSFAKDVNEVVFGVRDRGFYPLDAVASGFLRIRSHVLRLMIEELELPVWQADEGHEFWPFFMPLVAPAESDRWRYVNGDRAFDYRLKQIDVTPLADTAIRLWRWGRHARGWEDFGVGIVRPRRAIYRPRRG